MKNPLRFASPPVVEVACGTLFHALPKLRIAHIGIFWQLVRDAFPIADEASPLIDAAGLGRGFVELPFGGMPMARTWLRSADDTALIQLQRDRFVYNWKGSSDDKPYPSYDRVIAEFERYLSLFEEFIEREELGALNMRQLELTYVNHIPLNSLEPGDSVLIDHRREATERRFLPEPSGFTWTTSYQLPNAAGELSVIAQNARALTGGEPLIKLDLSARGLNEAGTNLRNWFDIAHTWITSGFVDITSQTAQQKTWWRIS
jgi:uncharacterized protein (TIGR04255 family)